MFPRAHFVRSHACRVFAFCTIASALFAMGCGGGSSMSASATGSTPTSGSTKPILTGLVTQGPNTTLTPPANNFEELKAHPGVYSAAVIQLYWSQLEPSQGVFDDSALVSALASLNAYNAQYPTTPVVGKLRIFMGVGTPGWVAAATGPVTVSSSNGTAISVGEYWTTGYDALWKQLQDHLAAEYDTNPMIGEVAITSCSSLTGEPFIMPLAPADIATLHQAGYTDSQQMACLTNAPADYASWKNTPLDYTFNAFSQTDTGFGVTNTSFPMQLMASFRAALGTRGVVANHGLQDPLTTDAAPIYEEFQTLYSQAQAAGTLSPLEFQTYGPTVDWTTAIPFGLTYHPTEIEIWDTVAAGGLAPLSQSQLAGWAASLKP